MKRFGNLMQSITVESFKKAVYRSFKNHSGEQVVIEFKENLDENCRILFEKFNDGTWKELLSYRKMRIVNNNEKVRMVDSPSLITRIYQYVFINILEPIYESKDNYNGLNCKKKCGITSKVKSKSVVHKLKHMYYDLRNLNYVLVIDQRKCYDHVKRKYVRKALKQIISDNDFIDCLLDVSFIGEHFPTGTPASPLIHNILMLKFDMFVKTISGYSIRYADDNILAFETKEEANTAKWMIKNFWWYEMGIRAKKNRTFIEPIVKPVDFCGYIPERLSDESESNAKGFMRIRNKTAKTASKCRTDESWASYFGLMKHADCFDLMTKIENTMKLKQLTEKIRIDRELDAPNIEIKELVGKKFNIYDYKVLKGSKGEPNWVKCLIGFPETEDDGTPTGRQSAREFHGSYQAIALFLSQCESVYKKEEILPLEDVEIQQQCGYIFKGSTNQMQYI